VSGGYQVTHTEVAGAAQQTDGKADDAESIRQKVTSANGSVPSKAWGLLGNMLVYGKYQDVYSTFSGHVDTMITGLRNLASDIKTTADQYKQNEDDVAKSFGDIENDLGELPPAKAPAGGEQA
jgi:uncharacterized protein YukE